VSLLLFAKTYGVLINPHQEDEILLEDLSSKEKLFSLLGKIAESFVRSNKIEIIFQSKNQHNVMRELFIRYLKDDKKSIQEIFRILADSTPIASGKALCFIFIYSFNDKQHLCIIRMPVTTEAASATINSGNLDINIAEDIYIKSAKSYKSVVFEYKNEDDFTWEGFAIDKQLSTKEDEVANYWIEKFLHSELSLKSVAGTRQLSQALKIAIKSACGTETKTQISSFFTFLLNHTGEKIVINDLFDKFGLPENTCKLFKFGNNNILHTPFELNSGILNKEMPYKSVHLDNGAIISAETEAFDNCFFSEPVEHGKNKYTTTGSITDIKYKVRV
jgi:hypothetical protein